MDFNDFSMADIWVVAPDRNARPLLGEARRLADGLGCYVHAVVTSAEAAEATIADGADRVHVTADAGAYLAQRQPEFVFFPLAHAEAAARLAQQLHAGLITDARNLRIDDDTRALLAARPVYAGEYFVESAIGSPTKMVTLDARFLPEPYADAGRSGEIINDPEEVSARAVRDLGAVDYTPQAWRPLTHARRIVAMGRALKDEAGVALARQLAHQLNAELAGDRSARDLGWIDEAHEINVTNLDLSAPITPELYVALGIRGDTAHNAAIAGARHVVAVYPDRAAAVFKIADEGVVADPQEFVRAWLGQAG